MKRTLPVPMASLHDRIDHVREMTPDFPQQLSEIAAELPISATQLQLQRLAKALTDGSTAATLTKRFPNLRWLLTVPTPSNATDVFSVMLQQSSYENELNERRLSKTAYPILLLLIALAIFFVLCIFVVPVFSEMFDEFGMTLPAPTRFLVAISDAITSQTIASVFVAFTICAAIAAVLWLWISDGPLKRFVLGYDRKSAAVRFSIAASANQLAELTEDQVPISQALQITAESNTDPTLRRTFANLASADTGNVDSFQHAKASHFLPRNFLLALQSDGTGAEAVNTRLLRVVAANLRELSIHRRDWTSFLLGPVAIVLIGLMILFVVIALFSPFFSLITALSG